MRRINSMAAIIVLLVGLASIPAMVNAQEVSLGADVVSSYVWRGLDCGDGMAIQPYVELGAGGLALGAWGSYAVGSDGAPEADLYAGYSFDFGLSIGVTDYFFPGEDEVPLEGVPEHAPPGTPTTEMVHRDYFDYDNHTLEANLGYEVGAFSLSANRYFDDNSNDDMYFEVSYDFGLVSLFVGAGDESYTTDGDLAICNFGISAEKEIEITDKYSLPLFGSVVFNPDSEGMYIVLGMSF